ncbi:MAG: Ni/Fe hydrogenase subunit alpha [Candidatus Eisenbacteria bacterium]|nr:Ni/Fe hydrogenase subunit alpha [Candidatus Eisenbacteria bacterium]
MSKRTLSIPHLGRVEGHGGIYVRIEDDEVREVNLEVYEGSRYYEALLRGKHVDDVQGIITRVCAICSASHTVAALMGLEDALGITVSARTHTLRGLLLLGSTIESHALHIFALALPDFFHVPSVLELAASHPREVTFGLKLKQLGNRIQGGIGGRAIHPVNPRIGGFGREPDLGELRAIREELEKTLEPLAGAVELIASLPIPAWAERPALFLALRPYEEAFRFRGVAIVTSDGQEFAIDRYRDVVREFELPHSHAKHSTLAGSGSYMTGSLARLKLFGHYLTGRAAATRDRLFPDGVPDNVLWNTRAQLVELVHCAEHGIELIDELLASPREPESDAPHPIRAGRGVAAIEVPRGVLFHEYVINEEGRVIEANVITPTAQNLANVEGDLRSAAQSLLRSPIDDVALKDDLEMVARAYDPCISCSVHVTRVPHPAAAAGTG